MQLKEAVKLYGQYQQTLDHSQNTIDGYFNDLMHFSEYLIDKYNYTPYLTDVTVEDIEEYLLYLNKVKGYAPNSRKRKLAVIRSLFRFCDKKKYCENNPAVHVESVRLDHRERIYLTEHEVEKIINQIEHYLIRLVVQTMYYTGMRISECLNLKEVDIDLNKGLIKVKMSKGRKDRIVPMHPKLRDMLLAYIQNEKPYTKTDCFFCTSYSGKLSRTYVNKMISLALYQLGWSQEITAHTFRHSFASNLLKKGANVVQIQKLLGHTSLSTTSIYMHVNLDELTHVINQL